MSRCLIHGVYADVWDAQCGGAMIGNSSPQEKVGMCMGIDDCSATHLLTCHRWYPNITDPLLKPVMYSG